MRKLIKEFIISLQKAESKSYDIDKNISLFRQSINSMANNHSEQLKQKISSHYSCKIDDEIIMNDGISYFFIRFFDQLQSINTLQKFLKMLKDRNGTCNYSNIFSQIMNLTDNITKDIALAILGTFEIDNNQWFFLFPSEPIIPKYLSYIEFQFNGTLVSEFIKIISIPFIKKKLQTLSIVDYDIVQLFKNKIKGMIYIVSMPSGMCGFTSQNLRIFIKLFGEKKKLSLDHPRIRGAIYITLLHELAHLLPRLNSTYRYEYEKNNTPPSDNEYDRTYYEYDTISGSKAIKKKGEGGYNLEKEIFGCKVLAINDEAAMELINFENQDPTPTEFQDRFNEKIKHGSQEFQLLKRSGDVIKIPSCGMLFIDHYAINK